MSDLEHAEIPEWVAFVLAVIGGLLLAGLAVFLGSLKG